MKLLHIITNTELGGAQRVCIELCNAALADGNEVAVTSMEGGYLWGALDEKVEKIYIPHMVKPISLKYDFKCYLELKKVIKSYNPDVIHLHSSKAGTLGRLAGFSKRKHIVYTVHGFDSIRLKHRFFLPLERFLQRFCGAVVGVSKYDEKNLRAEKITHNVSCIYNGIAKPVEKKLDALEELRGKKIIMTIARISPQKKIQMFLDVARQFDEDFAFVWIGGSDKFSMDEIKSQYDVPKNVYLLGDVPEASSYVHYADLFVLFSNFEGLPMSIIEALSMKKIIVASNVGGIPELVDEMNGRLVSETDEAVSVIKHLLEMPTSEREKMQDASYKKYESSFSVGSMWIKYRELYTHLLRR